MVQGIRGVMELAVPSGECTRQRRVGETNEWVQWLVSQCCQFLEIMNGLALVTGMVLVFVRICRRVFDDAFVDFLATRG